MQVVTTVKTTIQEVKKALRVLNPEIPADFVLDIDIEYNAEADKFCSVEQAIEDFNTWIDVPKDWNKPFCPTKFEEHCLLDVEFKQGYQCCNVLALEYWNAWMQEGSNWDIVKYRVSK